MKALLLRTRNIKSCITVLYRVTNTVTVPQALPKLWVFGNFMMTRIDLNAPTSSGKDSDPKPKPRPQPIDTGMGNIFRVMHQQTHLLEVGYGQWGDCARLFVTARATYTLHYVSILLSSTIADPLTCMETLPTYQTYTCTSFLGLGLRLLADEKSRTPEPDHCGRHNVKWLLFSAVSNELGTYFHKVLKVR
jgi:hypothetical protein